MRKTPLIFFILLFFSACHRQTSHGAAVVQKPEVDSDSNAAAHAGEKAAETSMIGFIKHTGIVEGCGTCALHLRSDSEYHLERLIFYRDDDDQAWINVDGQDIRLKLESSMEDEGEEKVGKQSTYHYLAQDLRVRVDYTITRLCDPDDEACEVTWYDATITVIKDQRKQMVKVTGTCGC